jgi:hypothetical protein
MLSPRKDATTGPRPDAGRIAVLTAAPESGGLAAQVQALAAFRSHMPR